ncbi:GDP-mannose mannosyl hydrolase [Vogesella facilis]|uniref:GDP-mannose mannosyl hydrolase n=1 Tax=Vogesella facilis TaxID=1655232 RepID=A0ABV7RG79_9NEIS
MAESDSPPERHASPFAAQSGRDSQLPFESFMNVVRDAPLISIDLIVMNSQGEALLGLRRNNPAAGFWFVPGGRVLKNETLDAAFGRLTLVELGCSLARASAQFHGVWEHFYDSNAGNKKGVGTHYVVLAYRVVIDEAELALPLAVQHQQYRWEHPVSISTRDDVHPHSRAYFH